MENSYGVGVVNRYALFLEEDADPLDDIKRRERERDRRKKRRDPEKENKAAPPAPAAAAPAKPAPDVNADVARNNGADADHDVKRGARDNNNRDFQRRQEPKRDQPKAPRPAQDQQSPNQQNQHPQRPRRDFTERRQFGDGEGGAPGEHRGPPRPRGGGGVGGGGGGSGRPQDARDARGKREFDRRSGSDRTGVKAVDKREGGGSHNWGSHRDDLNEHSEGEQTDPERADADQSANAKPPAQDGKEERPENENADGSPQKPAEEEPKELTLDEWKALRGERQKPRYNLRKAGEGEDLSRWKDMVELTKVKGEAGDAGDGTDEEYDSAEYPQRVGRQKRVIGIEFTFNEQRRGGGAGGPGGRGGRGGGGSGRGRGGAYRPRREERPQMQHERGHAPRQNAPKVDDNKDFPSLG